MGTMTGVKNRHHFSHMLTPPPTSGEGHYHYGIKVQSTKAFIKRQNEFSLRKENFIFQLPIIHRITYNIPQP